MSTNEVDSGGTTNTGASPYPTDDSNDGGGSRLQQAIVAVLSSLFPFLWLFRGMSVEEFTRTLAEFVIETVNRWIVATFVRPIVDAILAVGAAIVETVLLVAFGTDGAFGGPPGLVDLAVWVADVFVAATAGPTQQLVAVITGFNESIAAVAADAGLAAPFVVALLWGLELLVVGYAAWRFIRIIDFPLVDVDDAILTVVAPFKAVLRRFR